MGNTPRKQGRETGRPGRRDAEPERVFPVLVRTGRRGMKI